MLLDALDEEIRVSQGKRKIGSTGSGITRAYESKNDGNYFSLQRLLDRPAVYFAALRGLWEEYGHHFPNISADELVDLAREDRARLKLLQSE